MTKILLCLSVVLLATAAYAANEAELQPWWATVHWWTMAGTGSLGLVIGWLVRVFVSRTVSLGIKAFSTITSVVSGGATLLIWRAARETPLPDEANCYFIGVFLSVVFLGSLYYVEPSQKIANLDRSLG
jgi:uncharacterized membrane protein